MDYRDRNPNIEVWSGDIIVNGRLPFPFDGPTKIMLLEYDAPDYSTTFWSIRGDGGEDAEFNLWRVEYLIEAPKNCPKRQAFIFGHITWEEFWSHKQWLIELSMKSIFSDRGSVRYVTPIEALPSLFEEFGEYNHRSPLQLKHDAMASFMQHEWDCEHRRGPRHKAYEDFVRIYGQFVKDEAA